jgi:hypothetical protein
MEKLYSVKIEKNATSDPRVLKFVASTEDIDRDGDSISVDAWNLDEFKKNGVILWSHQYDRPPVAKNVEIVKNPATRRLEIMGKFPTIKEMCGDNEPSEHAKFTETLYNLCLGGYLNAVSVGCSYDQASPNSTGGQNVAKATLYEVSLCSVPANQNALRIASMKHGIDKNALDTVVKSMKIESKGAIPFHAYPLADEGTKWDGPAVVKASENEDLAKICAWMADKKPDEMTKGDYKLPHHLGKADGYKTVKQGVVAAVGAVMGARGGVNIPDADMDKVKSHLKSHYKEFKLDWPEDKAAWVEQCKAIGIKFINTKSGARLSADSTAHLDNLEKCMKDMADMHAMAMKHIQKLRNGEAPAQDEPGDSADMASDKDVIGGVYPENPDFTDEGFINVDFSM